MGGSWTRTHRHEPGSAPNEGLADARSGAAIPPAFAVLVAIAVLAVLVRVWFRAPTIGMRFGRPTRLLRVLIGVSAVALGIGTVVVSVAPSIGPGSIFGGSDPHLVAILSTGHPGSAYIYAYGRNAELRQVISVRNGGPVPITVLGIGTLTTPYIQGVALRLAPGGPTIEVALLRPGGPGQRWFSEPFAPFELAPGQETTASLVVQLTDCPGIRPLATLAPGAAIPAELPSGTGFAELVSLPVPDGSSDGTAAPGARVASGRIPGQSVSCTTSAAVVS